MFVTFEGVGIGSGKSTQAKLLAAWLREGGHGRCLTTREPGGTPVAEGVPRGSCCTARTCPPWAEAALLRGCAGRERGAAVIRPALERGECTSSATAILYSSVAYQGAWGAASARTRVRDLSLPRDR